MDDLTKTAVTFLALGLVLLTIGFATRNSSAGLFSMWAGIVTVLATIGYYIIAVV